MGFPFFPIIAPGCCSPVTKLLPPLDAVVWRADFPTFLGDPLPSSPLSLLDFFGATFTNYWADVPADTGSDRLGLASAPSVADALLYISC